MFKTFIILSGVALWWVAGEIGPYHYSTDETQVHHTIHSTSTLPTTNYSNSSTSISLSRDHVIIFFDNRVRYHTHEADNAYTKPELAAMVSVISQKFSKLLIDTAPKLPSLPPNESAPSRVWIPSVVAQHNLKYSKSPMEVIVSFEFDIDIYNDQEAIHQETSFDVARHMADTANNIFPGTVKTLMMTMYRNEKLEYAEESHDYTYWQYVQDWHNEDQFELVYLDHVYHAVWPYNLGIFMDVHDCGRFRGHLPHKVKEILEYMSTVALFIDPSTFHHLTTLSAQETHKMFVAKFDDCERKLKEAKSDVTVIPSTLWKSHHITIASMVEDWRVKNAWAVENNKEILMYEAFDTPGGRDFYYWGHGWWRLKDRSAFTINETSFVEKIEDANSKIYRQDLYSSGETSSSSEEVVIETSKVGITNCTKVSSNVSHVIPPPAPVSHSDPVIQYPPPPPSTTTVIHSSSTNHAVYIVLVILSAICAILVASQVYFHSRLINNSNDQSLKVRSILRSKGPQHHSFSNPILPGSLEDVSTTGLVNPRFGSHACTNNSLDNQYIINGAINLNDDGGEGCINGNVIEMSDTAPIVSVSYTKM